MSLRFFACLFLSLLTVTPVAAQLTSSAARFEEARADWDVGRFVHAMETLEGLLSPGVDPDLQDRIALLTGELFTTTELATDGRAIRWSPGGSYAAYESGAANEVTTQVLEVGDRGVREVVSVRGSGLVFAPSGARVAYLRLEESPALLEARARVESEFAGTDRAARMALRTEMDRLNAQYTLITVRDLASGKEQDHQPEGMAVSSIFFGPEGGLYFVGSPLAEQGLSDIYRLREDGTVEGIAEGPGLKTDPFFAADGSYLVFGTGRSSFAVQKMASGEVESFEGSTPVLSGDGRTLAYLGGDETEGTLHALSLAPGGVTEKLTVGLGYPASTSGTRACPSCPLQSGLSISPDGSFAVVQVMPREDWELVRVPMDGSSENAGPIQVTREIQHDLYPSVLADGRLLAMKGEGRHRRSHLYDLESGGVVWLFRNNTVRTVAPEYEWAPSPDGPKLLVVAERDGNTVSPERGVYLMDLARKVTREELLQRIRTNLASERELRARAEEMYGPLAQEIRPVVDRISTTRIFGYEEALFHMGSKNVSQPGNQEAIDYIAGKLREFGFEPELQWFDARGVQSANVIARIPGTVSPDVVYAVSAHFDSNTRSPGADDNTSATVGLLEMARVLADHPMPATIEIALFTGEESGLLGSREYVRRAVEGGKRLVGALNNDMVGFAEDHRLDNTIRYSNAGIRDLQHGAAMLFSEMVTHDAEYYKSTDAAAYYDAYGDIVGGIGSYPILASPHYHQSSDVLETVNHKLVTEVSRMSTASVMLMASVPSRLGGLEAALRSGSVEVRWAAAVEADVAGYRIAYGPEDDPLRTTLEVDRPEATLEALPPGTVISVKAVNRKGMEGWDWARVRVEG